MTAPRRRLTAVPPEKWPRVRAADGGGAAAMAAVTALAGRVAALAEGVAALAGRIAAIEAGHAGRVAALDRAAEMRAVAAVAPAGVALPAAFAPLRGREAQALEALLAAVAEAHGVAPADLRGVRRRRPLVRARQAFFAAALEAGHRPTQVGRFVGRDHSTVLTGAAAHRARLAAAGEGEA